MEALTNIAAPKCSVKLVVRVLTVLTMGVSLAIAQPAVSAGQAYGCPGDCNLDATVTIDELVLVVAMARGEGARDQCVSADANRDGRVRIDDVVNAVRRSMIGCPPMGWCGASLCQLPLPAQPLRTHSYCCFYSSVTARSGRIFWCGERDPGDGGCASGACNDACDGCRSIQRGDQQAVPEIICDEETAPTTP
jgi:hypothetical protein